MVAQHLSECKAAGCGWSTKMFWEGRRIPQSVLAMFKSFSVLSVPVMHFRTSLFVNTSFPLRPKKSREIKMWNCLIYLNFLCVKLFILE